jgi:MFS family permease
LTAHAASPAGGVVSALGYFVDILDLFLFNVVRQPSLRDLGVASANSLQCGMRLMNAQMVGVLIGALVWGILGDRRVGYVRSTVRSCSIQSVRWPTVWSARSKRMRSVDSWLDLASLESLVPP